MDWGGRRRRRGRTALGSVALIATIVASGVAGLTPGAQAQQVTPCDLGKVPNGRMLSTPPKYKHAPQRVVEIKSPVDGATIQIGLLRPKVPAGTQVPVLVDASPYYHALQTLDLRACAPFLADNFVDQGYAVALVPVRGTSDNGGCMDLMGPKERADLNRAVTWLGTQPWSNGSVGMIGLSYDGSTPWEVASLGNPHLKTIVPEEGVLSQFNLLFRGGTPDWRAPGILAGIYYAESVFFYAPGRSARHTAEVAACPEYATGEAASIASSITGELDPFGFYAAREYLDRVLANYRGSVFLVQGLQDWNVNPGTQFPFIQQLAARGNVVKQLIGQWDHTHPYTASRLDQRVDFADILLNWFDHWLRDAPTDLGPAVEVEDATGHWRTEPSWPPVDDRVDLWTTASGALTTVAAPPSAKGTATLAVDPAHTVDPSGQTGTTLSPAVLQAQCVQPFCAAFTTKPFPSDFRISGIPRVHLTVTPTGPLGDVSVYVYAQGANGLRRVGWGQADLRFPTGVERTAQPVRAGHSIVMDFALQPLDDVLRAGQRLVMMVSEANSYDRLPSLPPFPVILQLGGTRSGLTITHVNPQPSQLFTPRR